MRTIINNNLLFITLMTNKLSNRKLSQIISFLNKRCDIYLGEKKTLLNHHKMIEYLFNKPLEHLVQPNNIKYDSSVKIVRLPKNAIIEITSHFFILLETQRRFDLIVQLYEKQLDPKMIPKQMISDDHALDEKKFIMKILDKYEFKFKLSYVYNWNFKQNGEHLSLAKLPTVNMEQQFVYHFYGILINHGQMVQFVIEYDPIKMNRHEQQVAVIKQQILFQKNIHLLRLNQKMNLQKEIVYFLRKIKYAISYTIHNPIKTNVINKRIIQEMELFTSNYQYNHLIYLKLPPEKDTLYDSDDDQFFSEQIQELNPPVHEEIITDDVFRQIMKEKEESKTEKYSEADNIMVELIGNLR